MSVIIGIDVGGSITKIIGFKNERLLGVLQVRATDQVTSIFGALGNFLHRHDITIGEISAIVLTGVGASYFEGKVYGINTYKVDEFKAIGYGGCFLAGKEEAFVASLGTGTAFVRAAKDGVTHIGGSGVGGGTILGLAAAMLKISDIPSILGLARGGNLENVDLSVQEIFNYEMPSLPPNFTASNFGKIKGAVTDADLALGIINMVFQTVGMMAVFAARNDSLKDVVLTGSLASFPQVPEIFSKITDVFGTNFIIPQNAAYATAIGAVAYHKTRPAPQL